MPRSCNAPGPIPGLHRFVSGVFAASAPGPCSGDPAVAGLCLLTRAWGDVGVPGQAVQAKGLKQGTLTP